MENNSRKMTKYSVYGNSISREVPTKNICGIGIIIGVLFQILKGC